MTVRRLINNDYSFGNGQLDIISGKNELLQKCKTTLMQIKGEWFLNYRDGVAWGDILSNKTNVNALASLIRKTISRLKGVSSIESIDIDIENRYAYIFIKINTDFGLVDLRQSLNVLELIANDAINK
ncbi:hypothetical protein [Psychrobacter sp. AOP7-A1-24]|uniref:hypothetical protein n=1 Tax=Psychrobacter sp. AOP7-A1-24 TaxID=3457646 RepID=UPI00402B3CCE